MNHNNLMNIMEKQIRENLSVRKVYDFLFEEYHKEFMKTLNEDRSNRESAKLAVKHTWKEYCKLTKNMREQFKFIIEGNK